MKNTVLIGFLGIAIGFAAGWFGKPSPEIANHEENDQRTVVTRTHDRESDSSPSGSGQSSRSHKVQTRVVTGGRIEGLDAEMQERIQESQNRFAEAMAKRHKKKFEARIAQLTKKLNLTPEQVAKLQALWEENATGLEDFLNDPASGFGKSEKLLSLLKGDGLDPTLASILSDEQQEAYTELKQREHNNKVEARALKNFSKLSYLDLRPDQKDAIMEVLYDQAEVAEKKPSKTTALMSLMTDGMGIEIDSDQLGIGGLLDEQVDVAAATPTDLDPTSWRERAKERTQRRINEKVAALAPVLDEDQLAQYRANLEAKSEGLLSGGMFNFGAEVEIDESVEAPTATVEEE